MKPSYLFTTIFAILSSYFGNNSVASPIKGAELPSSFYDFELTNIDGKKISLSEFKGKVVLVVNVASRCGYTPQYEGLQKLYSTYKDKGLVILGFPANNFGAQEPGANEEIKIFCSSKYSVTFPMFSKISVKGADIHPLFSFLTTSSEQWKGEIRWNFTKFLIGKNGTVLRRFESKITPESDQMTKAIEEALQ